MTEVIESYEDLFKKGCIVHLQSSVWGASKTLPKSELKIKADPKYVKALKHLIDPDDLRGISSITNAARKYLERKALPFPIKGLSFVPRNMMSEIDEGLEVFKAEFDDRVEYFVSHYDSLISKAKANLSEWYNPKDYPDSIAEKFSLRWKYITVGAPGASQVLTPEIYEREQRKFEQSMSEFRETAVDALRESFVKMIAVLSRNLTGKRFYESSVSNLQSFLTDFDNLNITNDAALAEQVKRCKDIVSGIVPGTIKDDQSFRNNIAGSIDSIQASMMSMMKDRPKRKLRPAA